MSPPARQALPQAFFLPCQTGQRFCLYHPAQGSKPRGRVLYLHPFAEEMNATRRVVARQARTLAQAGYGVLQLDLLGCGDSSGDFADATWGAWLQDALQAQHWLAERGSGPLWLWGLRAGALLAVQLAHELRDAQHPIHLLLWQPVTSGQQMLQQFLRLHAASQWLGATTSSELPPSQALAQGQPVHIAGYALSSALAQGLGEARLSPPATSRHARLVWLEVSTATPSEPSPAAAKALTAWGTAGWQVQAQAVSGPAFWQTVGTDEAPALIEATLAALTGDAPP